MMYMPAVCPGGGRWAGQYNWTDTESMGWILPVAEEMESFFNDLFSYGIATATPATTDTTVITDNTTDTTDTLATVSTPTDGGVRDPWPGVWAPPMVKAAWSGSNMAAYETDFFSDLEADNPEARTVYGKGQRLLEGEKNRTNESLECTREVCARVCVCVCVWCHGTSSTST